MKRLLLLFGFLLLIAVETFAQVGFKIAGQHTLPMTLDMPWLGRVVREPWTLAPLGGYATAFLLYMTILRHAAVGPIFAAAHLQIVSITLISVYFFGDSVSPLQAVGCCAIVAGVVVLAATERPATSSPKPD